LSSARVYFHCRLKYKIPLSPYTIKFASHAHYTTVWNAQVPAQSSARLCCMDCFIVARDTAAHSLIKHAGKSLNERRDEGAGWAWPCTPRRPHC
jgi:hypothetical protein